MQNRYERLLGAALTAVLLLIAEATNAGPLEDALAAHSRGDDATA